MLGNDIYNKLVEKSNKLLEDSKIEIVTYTLKKEKIGSTVSHYADWDKARDSKNFKIEDENGDLYLSYPVLSGNTNDIINLNNIIKNHIEENIDELNNDGLIESKALGEDKKHETCYWAKLLKSGETKQYSQFIYLEYEVIESNQYISIIESMHKHSECATGGNAIQKTYIVDKKLGKIINEKDVVNDNIISSFKTTVKEYLQKHHNETDGINARLEKLNNFELCYVFYSKSNNIVIAFQNFNDGILSYEYVNGKWIEYK